MPETFTLQPSSFGLYLVGDLTLQKGPIDFVLAGVFDIDFKYDSGTGDFTFNLFAFAELTLEISGQNLFTFDAIGLIQINNDGFAAMLAVQTSGNSFVSFNFNFALFVNSTGDTVSYTLPADLVSIINQDSGDIPGGLSGSGLLSDIKNFLDTLAGEFAVPAPGPQLITDNGDSTFTINIPAGAPQINGSGVVTTTAPGPYLLVEGSGTIYLLPGTLGTPTAPVNGHEDAPSVQGMAIFEASASGLTLYIEGSMHFGPLVIAASGDIEILFGTNWGIVAAISLAASINIASAVSLGGAATLEINTTGSDETVKEFQYNSSSNTVSNTPVDVTIPGTELMKLRVQGELVLGPNAIALKGAFLLSINTGSGPIVEIAADASLSFFGINLNINAAAAIGIFSDGSFAFYINLSVGFNIANLITFSGSVTLSFYTASSGSVSLESADGNSSYTINAGFAFTFDMTLNILSVLNFEVVGAIKYDATTNVFSLFFLGSANINLYIIDTTFTIGGWFDSTGEFAAAIYGDFHFGISGVISLDGYGYLQVAYGVPDSNGTFDSYWYGDSSSAGTGADLPELAGVPDAQNLSLQDMPKFPSGPKYGSKSLFVGGQASLDGELFGFDIATITVGFKYQSGQLSIHVGVKLNFFLFSITISFTLTIGSISAPPQVYLAGTPTANQVSPGSFQGGPLILNVGNRAGYRNLDDSDTNEQIMVTGGTLTNGAQVIYVTYIPADGSSSSDGPYTETFTGVTNLTIPGDGANDIEVASSVAIPVYITGGATGEAATLIDAGTGGGTITGGPDDDLIETGGGKTTVVGGGGHDTIIVGAGGATINTASGDGSRVLWNADTSGTMSWVGTAGDVLYIAANDPSGSYANGETMSMAAVGTNMSQFTPEDNHTATITSVSSVVLSAPGGGNNITIGNMVGGGVSSLQISYGATHSLPDQITVLGSTGSDTYTINSSTDTLPAIPTATLDPSTGKVSLSTPSSILSVPTVNVDRTNGLQIEVFGISHTAGDSLTVNSKGGNDTFYVESVDLPTTLQGNDVNFTGNKGYTSTFFVGWAGIGQPGSLSEITALLTILGTPGSDTLEMYDNADLFNRTFTLTNTQLYSDALGNNGRLVYNSLIDVFDLFAGPGQNSYAVTGTGAVGQTHIIAGDTDMTINAGSITTPTSVDGGADLGLSFNGDPLVGGNVLFVNGTSGNDKFVIAPGEIDVTANGGSLTVPIFFTDFQTVVIEGQGGNDTFIVNGNNLNLLIDDPLYNGNADFSSPSYTQVAGTANITVNGNSSTMTLFGGSGGVNSFTINGNGGTIDINDPSRVGASQGNGSGTYTVNGNSSNLTINGLAGTNTFNVNANSNHLNIIGGQGLSASNLFNILGNFGTLAIDSEGGSNVYNISGISSPVAITTDDYRPATLTISAPLHAAVTFTGYPGRSSISTLIGEFDGGSITDDIDGTFKGYGIVLSNSATVTMNSATSWTITDGSTTYAINEDPNGLLEVTKATSSQVPFTDANIGGGDASALTGGSVSGALASLFASHGITLAGETVATVSGTEWTITNGSVTYRVFEDANGLLTIMNAATAGLPFTDPDADINGLNSNSISGNLSTLFSNAGVTLSSPAVATNSTINWTITSGTDQYSVTETSIGTLVVSDSTGHALFTDTDADIAALANSSVNANLTSLFTTAGITLSSPTVTSNSQTSWSIVNGTNTYSVTAESNGTLVIADSATGGLPFIDSDAGGAGATALNNGLITTQLSDAFAADSITLAKPTVVAEVPGSEWLIYNGGSYYLVTENSGLVVTPYTFVADSVGTGFIPPTQVINVNGTSANENYSLSTTSISGVGATINYTGLVAVNINGNGGHDTFTISGNTGATSITTGIGTATITVTGLTDALTINSQLGINTITMGSTLGNLAGAIKIHGSGYDSLTLNDTGDVTGINLTLSSTTLTAAAPSTFGGLTYSGLSSFALNLGSGADTLLITSTNSTTPVTINTGNGADTVNIQGISSAVSLTTGTGIDAINIGTLAPTLVGGNLSLIQAGLAIHGGRNSTLSLDDDSNGNAGTATITSSTFAGLDLVGTGITYSGLSGFNLTLDNFGNTLTVASTAAATSYSITGGTFGDTINVQSTNATGPVAITTGTGTNVVNIASSTNTLAAILGQISVTGTGTDTLNLNDSGSSTNRTIDITATQINITGLAAVLYTTIDTLNITLGSGTITGTIDSTAVGTATTLTTGSGNDSITINGTSTANTSVITGTGNDHVYINAIGGPTSVNVGTGTNSVVVGGASHLLSGITAALTLSGLGTDSITLDDSANGASSSTLAAGSYTTTSALGTITFSGDTTLASLTLDLGNAANGLTISGTPATATTTVNANDGGNGITITGTSGALVINTGPGDDGITVQAIGGPTTIYTGAGDNTVNVSSASDTLTSIQGLLTIDGTGGTTTLLITDSGDSHAATGTLTASTLTGFGMATAGMAYSNILSLVVYLGSGGTNITVASTSATQQTDIDASTGNDTITLASDSSLTYIFAGTGNTTVNIQGTSAQTNVLTATGGHDTINIGNNGSVSGIGGDIEITGDGMDVVTVDDSASITAKATPLLTATDLRNLSTGDINYSRVASLTIKLGTAADTFTIANTGSTTLTTIDLGTAADHVIVDNDSDTTTINTNDPTNVIDILNTTAPTSIVSPVGATDIINIGDNGSLSAILFPITITGDGNDTVNIDDSADTNAVTATLSATSLIGMAPAEIDYSAIATLNLNFGSGSDSLAVTNTATSTTNINMNGGNDSVSLQQDAGPTNINMGTGNNTLAIQATGAATTVTTPTGGATSTTLGDANIVDGITAPLSITGSGSDSLVVDDQANPNTKSVTMTNGTLTGLIPQTLTYSGIATLIVNLGTGGNFLVVSSTPAATSTTFNTGSGSDFVTIGATSGPLTINTQGGNNAIDIGGLFGSTLAAITGAVNLNGDNFDVLTIDETYQTTADTGVVTPTTITGLSPATITYSDIKTLLMTLGSSTNVISVTGTSSSSTVSAGAGQDNIDVSSGAPNAGGTLGQITNPLYVIGNGDDNLTLDDSGDTAGKTVTVTNKQVAGASSAPINYSGLNTLSLLLGSGDDNLTVSTTILGTSDINAGNGNNAVTVDATQGDLNLTTGSGNDTITLQTISNTTTVNSGDGNDTVNLQANTAATSITTGTGTDVVNISSTAPTAGGNLDGINAVVNVTGGGETTLNLDDSGSTVASSSTFTAGVVNGLSPANIDYSGLSNLNVQLGTGVQTVTVHSTSAGADTVITAGSANDTFTLNGANGASLASGLAGPITVNGALGTNSLSVDDSTDTATAHVVLTATTITGIGSTITYLNFANFGLVVGSNSDLTVNGVTPGTNTNVSGGGSTGYPVNLGFGAGFTGTLSLSNVDGGTINITGDLSGAMSLSGNLDGLDVSGNLSGTFSLTGNLGSLGVGGDLSGTATIGGNLGSGTLDNLSGTLTIGGTAGQLTVTGNLSGQANIGGDLTAGTIGTLSGALNVTGTITALTINGADSGTITAGSVGTISLPHAVPTGAANNLFDLTQGGIYRAIRAIPDNNANLSGLSANIFYEGSTSPSPEAGVRLTNTNASQMFDLVLSATGVSTFNLERIDSVSGAKTGLFNLDVNGSLVGADSATKTYFGYANTTTPNVDLPADHLGLVAVSQNMPSDSILASSIQGIAFASLGLPNGTSALASAFQSQTQQLFNVLAINPATKKPYAQVLAPTGAALRAIISPASSTPVGVFTGWAKKGTKFAANALYFSDQNSDLSGTLMADVTFSAGARSHGRKVVTNINFEGDGGSVNTWSLVNNIHSDGWLGDISLEGGYAKLQSLTAPAIHGNINLFGGKLVGQLQTTGEEIDPITGSTTAVSGDLGTLANGSVTTLHVNMAKGSSIVVRGNLISHVVIDKGILGDISVAGNIGSNSSGIRTGGINTLSSAKNTGTILATGDIDGDISLDGNLAGRIAAKCNILSKVTISGAMMKGSAVISNGEIGDTTLGTKLTVEYQDGMVVAGSMAIETATKSTGKTAAVISNADSKTANADQLANLWTNGGSALSFDSAGTLNESGLKLMQTDINNLKANNGTLSGTTA
ncbi:MAG TPA: hypothetical protein VGG19_18645 [Tepidisphaeraceae bacterium]